MIICAIDDMNDTPRGEDEEENTLVIHSESPQFSSAFSRKMCSSLVVFYFPAHTVFFFLPLHLQVVTQQSLQLAVSTR